MRSKNILQFHNVSFHYDEKPIINELNASIQDKEFVEHYRTEWMREKYFISPYYRFRRSKYGTDRADRDKEPSCGIYAPKDMLLPWRTIIENAALPLECQGVQKKEASNKGEGTIA